MVSVHFRSQLSYRISFLFDFVSMVMVALLEFLAFALVLPKFDTIGGWTLGEVALLIGMMNMAFGLMDMIFAGFDPGFFGNQIRLGRFDQLLLRPVNITLQVLTLDFMLRRLGRVFVGIGILAYAITLTPINWTASKIAVLVCAVLGQIGFFGALFIIGATITFWTVDSIEIVNIFTYGGSEMISYPIAHLSNLPAPLLHLCAACHLLKLLPCHVYFGKTRPAGDARFCPLAGAAGRDILAVGCPPGMAFWHPALPEYRDIKWKQ